MKQFQNHAQKAILSLGVKYQDKRGMLPVQHIPLHFFLVIIQHKEAAFTQIGVNLHG